MSKRRVMIKLSGEALSGKSGIGIDPKVVKKVALEIEGSLSLNLCEIGIVVGGGNTFSEVVWR